MQHYFGLVVVFLLCDILAGCGISKLADGSGRQRHQHRKQQQGQKPQGLHKGDHKCDPKYGGFCQNGRDCELFRDAVVPHCHCLPGYRGKQCENKNPQITTTTTPTTTIESFEPITEPESAVYPPWVFKQILD